MRRIHRFLAPLSILIGLYMASTGLLLQSVDLKTLLSHVSASNPNLEAIREGLTGPPNFAVQTTGDYSAKDLPAALDLDAAITRVAAAERAATGNAPMSFIELRMQEGQAVGQVASEGKLLRFDAVSGEVLTGPEAAARVQLPPLGNQGSLRNQVKGFHRLTVLGNWGQLLFVLSSLTLCVVLISGLAMYFQLLRARAHVNRTGLFWSAGGAWRSIHRAIAILASIFLLIVVFSGTFEALNSAGSAIAKILHGGKRPGLSADVSSPLQDAELLPMLHTTLASFHAASPETPIRVVRLRYFAGIPQGIVIAGGEEAQQFAFNASTGATARFQGPGYPSTGQTFGWQWDQWMKQIHRGDAFGLSGRWMSLLTGIALLILSVSGTLMYVKQTFRQRTT